MYISLTKTRLWTTQASRAFLELRVIATLSCNLSALGHSIIQLCTPPKTLSFQISPLISKIRSLNVFGSDIGSSLDTFWYHF